ncbi:hypothetical protein B0I37DRAFT_413642 [Chaetomium sp. MPI-CAGE-AT-0009]|nr:hypothetical protein B0I37DRAFT_413642 [Chaetomium sp. MPI-CAGE-AT-0009]
MAPIQVYTKSPINAAKASGMSIPPPQAGYNQCGTSSSATGYGVGYPTGGYPGGGGGDVSGPAGYQQNTSASSSGYVPSAYHRSGQDGEGDEDEEGFLGSAMKFAKAAGERLSAAESEVWRRINGEGGR